jgi:hypothetical protein
VAAIVANPASKAGSKYNRVVNVESVHLLLISEL